MDSGNTQSSDVPNQNEVKSQTSSNPFGSAKGITIDDKTFYVSGGLNERGPFVKIVETNRHHRRRNHIVIPKHDGAEEIGWAILALFGVEKPTVSAPENQTTETHAEA